MRRMEASHADTMYAADESYGTPGMIPPFVASTIRARRDGSAASTLPSASSHVPKPVPPQSRPYTSAVSTRFMPASSAADTRRAFSASEEPVKRQHPNASGPMGTSPPSIRGAGFTRFAAMRAG